MKIFKRVGKRNMIYFSFLFKLFCSFWNLLSSLSSPHLVIQELLILSLLSPAKPECESNFYSPVLHQVFWASSVKSHLQCGRPGFDPWVRKIPLRRAWQPTPLFFPGESPWTEEPGGLQSMGHKKSGMTERLRTAQHEKYHAIIVYCAYLSTLSPGRNVAPWRDGYLSVLFIVVSTVLKTVAYTWHT